MEKKASEKNLYRIGYPNGMDPAQQQTMEEMLYDSIYDRWGTSELPDRISMMIEARKAFDLDLKDARTLVHSMIDRRLEDFVAMGYEYRYGTIWLPRVHNYIPSQEI